MTPEHLNDCEEASSCMHHNSSDVVAPVRIIPECGGFIGILETAELEKYSEYPGRAETW